MASRLLARSKTLALARFSRPGATADPVAAAAAASSSPQCFRSLHSLASRPLPDPKPATRSAPPKPDLPAPAAAAGLPHSSRASLFRRLDYGKNCSSGAYLMHLPFAVCPTVSQTFLRQFSMKAGGFQADKSPDALSSEKNKLVNPASSVAFSPLEGTLNKVRKSSLGLESFKVKQMELSIKLTYALIPALLLISKTKLTTSVLVMSVYWQVYGFFKEIILDYVHHEVTRKWVFIYFKLLLLILAKETLLDFNME